MPEYEFDDSQNEVVSRLSRAVRQFSYPLFGLSATGILGAFLVRSGNSAWTNPVSTFLLLLAVSCFFCGLLASKASRDLALIVNTEGSDITHLMTFFTRLKRIFLVFLAPTVTLVLILFVYLLSEVV